MAATKNPDPVWGNEFKPMPGRVQTKSQQRLNEKANGKAKRIRTRSQTRSDKKPNAFRRKAKHVWLRSQTRSNKSETRSNKKPTAFKANAFRRKTEHVRSASTCTCVWEKCKTRSNENLPVFKREPTRVWTTTFTRSNEDQHAFEHGPSRVQTRIYTHLTVKWTRSFHMWNAFALYLVSDWHCRTMQ